MTTVSIPPESPESPESPLGYVNAQGEHMCVWHGDEVPMSRCPECLSLLAEFYRAPVIGIGGAW